MIVLVMSPAHPFSAIFLQCRETSPTAVEAGPEASRNGVLKPIPINLTLKSIILWLLSLALKTLTL
jgi:hypothetical protein